MPIKIPGKTVSVAIALIVALFLLPEFLSWYVDWLWFKDVNFEKVFNGRLVAYAIADAGSDWQIWRVRDVDTGKDLPDEVRWAKFTGASFSKDGKGFYYARFAASLEAEKLTALNMNQKVWYHAIGSHQNDDVLVYERPDQPEWNFTATVSDDGRWLVIAARKGSSPERAVFVQDLAKPGAKPEPLLSRMDAAYDFVDVVDDTFYFVTDRGAPRKRLVAVSWARPEEKDSIIFR